MDKSTAGTAAETRASTNGAGNTAAASLESRVSSIGPKVRELRQGLDLSLQQLAGRADVSAAAIHKVERGDMVPTITTLLKLAAALGKPVGHFIDEPEADTSFAVLTAQKKRPEVPVTVPGVQLAGISGPPERFHTTGAVLTVEPGVEWTGRRARRTGEDLLFMLSGTLEVEVAGERHTLRRGDALHCPAHRPSSWRNPGSTRASAVWIAAD